MGVAHKQAAISVDVHVHRAVNRWGLIETTTPEQTMLQLEQKLTQQKWIDINRLLMPFGKHLHGTTAALFHLSCIGILPAGGCNIAQVSSDAKLAYRQITCANLVELLTMFTENFFEINSSTFTFVVVY